ncbi:hypothetical protein SMICM304S_01051 [Streptomyces microflavus]
MVGEPQRALREEYRSGGRPPPAAAVDAPEQEREPGRELGGGDGPGPGAAHPRAEAAGLDGVEFDPYGITPPRPLDALRPALRPGDAAQPVRALTRAEPRRQRESRTGQDREQSAQPGLGVDSGSGRVSSSRAWRSSTGSRPRRAAKVRIASSSPTGVPSASQM